MSLSPGTRLGSYEIISPIGAGGMGEVFRARSTRLNREVALKLLPETFAQDLTLPGPSCFLPYVEVLDFPDDAASHYAEIRADLKKRGALIGANDLLIAGCNWRATAA